MGLMDLLRGVRRRDTDTDTATEWLPLYRSYETLRGSAADMGDGGQTLPHVAHQVVFGCANSLGSTITVAVYVTDDLRGEGYGLNNDEGYALAAHYTYACEDDPGWYYANVAADPENEIFEWEGTADSEAEVWAANLGAGNGNSMGNLAGVFAWNGEPFDLPDED